MIDNNHQFKSNILSDFVHKIHSPPYDTLSFTPEHAHNDLWNMIVNIMNNEDALREAMKLEWWRNPYEYYISNNPRYERLTPKKSFIIDIIMYIHH